MGGVEGLRALVRGRDVALAYAAVVAGSSLALFSQSDDRSGRLVLAASTNLDNLRHHPLVVLVVSAFVLPSPWALAVLPVLVWAYGVAQRRLGRAQTLLVAGTGHVVATVLVAFALATGVAQHVLDRRLTHEPDVGVSYGLAAVLGVLLHQLPRRLRLPVGLVATAVLVVTALVSETFTDLGHLLAWGIGVVLGSLLAAHEAQAPPRPG
jgi:hypothetical protein